MAGWYRTGTVSLTQGSAVVVGAGPTLWVSTLRAGMVFTTDFTTLYEVTAVTDDTHLTLDRPWTGSAVSGVAYAVIYGGAAISNAEIVAELMTMVGKWQTREDQYDDWLAGEPDGGPNGDGRYPLTDSKGATRLVTSPGRLLWLIDEGLLNNVQQVVDAIRDDIADAQRAADVAASAATTLTAYVTSAGDDRQAAEAARDAARAAETAAGLSAATAATSAGTIGTSVVTAVDAAGTAVGARDAAVIAHTAAEGARNVALGARDAAVQARDSSFQARDVSTQARDQAVASQTAAGASQARAQEAMSTAVNAAADSVDAKIHAVAAQVVAEQRRNEASGFADSAKAWAVNPVGLPVVSGGFSALHWADLARGYAQQAQVIAGGYMFGAVGDGSASRISAQAAADVLHLVQGAGMIINFDQATRKVTFSSIARAVASEDPALTVRLDEAAALAYLGIDRSKLDHGTLVNVGTHGHTEIDAHLDNATIHVPAPGSGDLDKLLKATGAGTFAWVKGAGSGIDADRLDGLSWEEGIEVASNAAADWVKLGTWAATSAGRRLLIQATGCGGFANNAVAERGGVTWISVTIGNNISTTAANIQGAFIYFDNPLFSAIKFRQTTNRYAYEVFAQRVPYAAFNYRVSTSGTWVHSGAAGQADPGADSATVRAATSLGRQVTTNEVSATAGGSTIAQRSGNGDLAAVSFSATGSSPAFNFQETDADADAKRWQVVANDGRLTFQTLNDSFSAGNWWLRVGRNGNTPSHATFSVPIHTSRGALGTAAGTQILHDERFATVPNNDFLRTVQQRKAAGSNWDSAVWRIQRTVDSSDMGFVQFGLGVVGNYTVGVGLGTSDALRLWVPSSGNVTIDGNGVWHAGNFDPATKAGTAVATVAANGLMAAADKQTLGGATAAAMAGALVQRDSNGGAAFGVVTASNVKVGSADVWHKGTLTDLSQLTNGPGFITAAASIIGNAATATTLQTARTINGVLFNGSASIIAPDLRVPEMTGKAFRVPRIAASGAALEYLDPMAFGQCRLGVYDPSTLILYRHNGKYLFINGRWEVIPVGHVPLASSALISGGIRYIYAYMSGATMTLEASASTPGTDATHGHQIKNGDPTRTLVGMATVSGSGTFTGNVTLFTKSWFNRLPRTLAVANTNTVTHYGNEQWQNASNLWGYFMSWADESSTLFYAVSGYATGANTVLYASHLIDGNPNAGVPAAASSINNSYASVSATHTTSLSEALHSFGVGVLTSNGLSLSLPAFYTTAAVMTTY